MRSISPHPRTDGLVHISLLQHYHQTHLAGTNILKDIPSRMETLPSFMYKYRYFGAFSLQPAPFCLFLIILTQHRGKARLEPIFLVF